MDESAKDIFNNTSSDFSQITVGVPSGSVVGPLLLLVYINVVVMYWKGVTVFYMRTTLYW